jgi:hypothetical protein
MTGNNTSWVDDDERWLYRLDVPERGRKVRFGGQVDLVVGAAGAFGPKPDLAGRLLARQIQCAPAGLRP